MVSLTPFVSLLSGPTICLQHTTSRTKPFRVISQAVPLCMLAHFSLAIRHHLPRSLDCMCNKHAESPRCPLHGCRSTQAQAPSAAVKIVGGHRRTYLDLMRWMEQCCHQHAIVPLSTVLTELAQQARALGCIDILRIEALQNEKPDLIRSIQVNSIGPKEGRDLYRAGEDIPQVILDTMCQSIATRFANDLLGIGTLDNWYEVADRHGRFDAGVRHCLNVLQSQDQNSQGNEKFGIARRVWARRGVNRDGKYLERRSFERMRSHSDVVPDLSASQQERHSRAVGKVTIEAYLPSPSAYSRPPQTSQPSWVPQQQPQPPWANMPPNGAAPPMPVETTQVHHTVHHFHHLPGSRTHRDRPINTNSRYQYRRSSSHSHREHEHRGWRRLNILTGKFTPVDD